MKTAFDPATGEPRPPQASGRNSSEDWAYKYGPPPDELPENDHGWPQSWLMLAFVIVGPLVYFGPELRTAEMWLVAVYRAVEAWLLPVRDWLLG